MESWSYVSYGGKGMVSGTAAESPSGSISRTGFENRSSNQQPQAMGPSFDELGVPQLIRPPNPVTAFSKDSNSSSLIDLKLGRFGDLKDHGSLVGPAKRARTVMSSVAAAYCQVYGCNKDLSSSKDYHKRHKVCEVHSKTATVIVNGIQQRFCQQCSRFHLQAEFDDGKRSCRKRLAGHNERRRKPQAGAHSGKLPQQFNENRLSGIIFAPASFICQDILPSSGGGLLNSEVKVENRADYGPFSAIPIPNGQTLPKPTIPPYTFDKHFPFFHDASSSLGGPEDFSAFSTGISDPRCALSLLSSPSRNSSTHSSGFPVAQTLIGMAEPTSHQSGPAQDGPTISMSQLSSQLQRVESQRQSVQTKQGRGGFYCRRIA